jgi:hypothetical protein
MWAGCNLYARAALAGGAAEASFPIVSYTVFPRGKAAYD